MQRPEPYYSRGGCRLYLGDCREVIPAIGDRFTAVVCDPPYGLSDFGYEWDVDPPGVEFWRAHRRALLPGAPVLAFGSDTRWHHLAMSMERSGLETRQDLMLLFWINIQGFPKGNRVGGKFRRRGLAPLAEAWDGHSTTLAPGYEAIVHFREPLIGPVVDNILGGGVGGINQAEISLPSPGDSSGLPPRAPKTLMLDRRIARQLPEIKISGEPGEYIIDGKRSLSMIRRKAEQRLAFHRPFSGPAGFLFPHFLRTSARPHRRLRRYCFSPKASGSRATGERPLPLFGIAGGRFGHPSLKPLPVLRWLMRLVKQPAVNLVLDGFAGTATSGVAAMEEGMEWVGVELSERYAEMAATRLEIAANRLNLR